MLVNYIGLEFTVIILEASCYMRNAVQCYIVKADSGCTHLSCFLSHFVISLTVKSVNRCVRCVTIVSHPETYAVNLLASLNVIRYHLL